MSKDRLGYKKMVASTFSALSFPGKPDNMLRAVQRRGKEWRPSESSPANTHASELGNESFLS